MSLITVKDLELRFNKKEILKEISFVVPKEKKIGLVGINGSGKSSLLKIIAEKIEHDSGKILYSNDLKIFYLPQELNYKKQTINEYLYEFEFPIKDPVVYADLLKENSKYFNLPDFEEKMTTLSGGLQRQVSLLKAFSHQPDLLLLDEPTNHLDVVSLLNLQDLFNSTKQTILYISHDRYFLDKTVEEIWELEKGNLYKHPGSYTKFIQEKDRRRRDQQIRYDKNKQELAREHEWFISGVKARSTKDQGRTKRYYELKDWVKENKPKWQKPYLPIPQTHKHGNQILKFIKLQVDLPGSQKPIVNGLNYEFTEKVRLGLLGPNGSGKTTLLRSILDIHPHTKGKIVVGLNTEFNYQDQKRLELDDDLTIHQSISEGNIETKFGDKKVNVFAYMKHFLFFKEDLDQAVKTLSGGQRARLLLAKILKQGGNFLILDEPTNDLDVDTIEALENTLKDFPGPVLFVSHDRYFLDKICTQVLALEGDGEFTISNGGYTDYINKYGSEKDFWQDRSIVGSQRRVKEELSKETKKEISEKTFNQKSQRKIRQKMREIEKDIEKLSAEIKAKQVEISYGDFYLKKPHKIKKELALLEELEAKKEALETKWLELSDKF